ncbi:MAG: response regulator transcription factor, partial [Spirochaetota bacterium]
MIKALIVDDQSLFLDSLELFLRQDDSIEVIGTATNGTDALAMIRVCEPDVLLLDLRMPALSGLDAARMVRMEFPRIKIIILTTFDDDSDILQTLVLGCEAYI